VAEADAGSGDERGVYSEESDEDEGGDDNDEEREDWGAGAGERENVDAGGERREVEALPAAISGKPNKRRNKVHPLQGLPRSPSVTHSRARKLAERFARCLSRGPLPSSHAGFTPLPRRLHPSPTTCLCFSGQAQRWHAS